MEERGEDVHTRTVIFFVSAFFIENKKKNCYNNIVYYMLEQR